MKKKIGEILIAHAVNSAQEIGEALALQADGDPSRLGEILVQRGCLEADALARALAEQKALPYTDLSLVSSSFSQAVPLGFQHRHGLLPFEELRPGEFCIAVADPLATDAIEQARHWLKAKSIQLYVASSEEIGRVLSAMEDQRLDAGEILELSGVHTPAAASLEAEELASLESAAEDWAATGKNTAVPEEADWAVTGENTALPEASAQAGTDAPAAAEQTVSSNSTLSEEDLFGSLQQEEEAKPQEAKREQEAPEQEKQQEKKLEAAAEAVVAPVVGADDLTQIVRRPGPPSDIQAAMTEPSSGREMTPRLDPLVDSGKTILSLSPFGMQLAKLLDEREPEVLSNIVLCLAELLVKKSLVTEEEVLDVFASSPAEKW